MSDVLKPEVNLNSSSPICRLPLDLLHVIFDFTRRDPPSAAPFTLSHVCHEWRSFLLESPLLWNTIVIERVPLPDLEYYDLWLHRTQRLDLYLHVQTSSLNLAPKDLHTFTQVIRSMGSLCKEIEVPGTFSPLDKVFRSIRIWLTQGRFPKLIKLHLPRTDAVIITERKLEAASMPNLESLIIHHTLCCLSTEWFSTCRRLRRLHLIYDDLVLPSALLSSLHRIIQLISAHIEDLNIHVPGHCERLAQAGLLELRLDIVEMPKDIILLPKLTKLSLSWGEDNYEGHSFCGLSRLLRAPKLLDLHNLSISTLIKEKVLDHYPRLEHLGLTGRGQDEPAASQGLLSPFNTVQLGNLHSVRLGFVTCQGGDFATVFLQSCPQLVYLRIHQCFCVRETDLRRLVKGREVSEELATLRYLGLLNCNALELNEVALAWFGGRLEAFEYVF